jgi:hypothetical protein
MARRWGIDYEREAPHREEGHNVTVCIAALFRWNYAPVGEQPNVGIAAICASDRKLTAGDIEYEPPQRKISFITPRTLILVAGDIAVHSEAIMESHKQIKRDATVHPHNIAKIYGQAIQAIKRRHAEDIFLAPVGLNTDIFIAQQHDLSEGFIDKITNQLQRFEGTEVEALIVGSDGENAHIYTVDKRGMIATSDDIGFAAIGIGAWHARSRLMQVGYVNSVIFAPALAAVFAAKRAAEIAPGVGKFTDMHLVMKDAVIDLMPNVAAKLPELYDKYIEKRTTLEAEIVSELQEFMNTGGAKDKSAPKQEEPKDAQRDSSEKPQEQEQ